MSGPTSPVLPLPQAAPAGTGTDRLREAALDFEAVFLAQMLKGMTQGLEGEGPLGGDGPFADMLLDAYARLISRAGGVGIADAVVREMVRAQEGP